MKTITSVSGGKTSAYMAANYPTDLNVFALVRTNNKDCLFPDKKLRQVVEDRIGKPFIGTLEDDTIIYTILDLEQFLGKKIFWVSGNTFDHVVKYEGGWLPNKLHRYCTTHLKVSPIFYWWAENIGEPITTNFGYRANEVNRAKKMLNKTNKNGLLEFKATFEKHTSGRHKGNNKWEVIEWQKPNFPLIQNGVFRWEIENYWEGKNVRFANLNNCVGCFHRNPMLLKKMSTEHPNKFDWFANQEGGKNGFWRSDTSYQKIKDYDFMGELSFSDFSECDSGFCEV